MHCAVSFFCCLWLWRGFKEGFLPFVMLKKCQINVLANYMYICVFRWSKSVVLEGRSEAASKQLTIPAAEGQDFTSNPKKSKKNWVEFGQNETISSQITNCSKFNKLALLTLRAEILKYTCNPPKHMISQYSENSEDAFKVKFAHIKYKTAAAQEGADSAAPKQ